MRSGSAKLNESEPKRRGISFLPFVLTYAVHTPVYDQFAKDRNLMNEKAINTGKVQLQS